MRKAIYLFIILVLISSSVHAQLKQQQTWQAGTVSGDSLSIQCSNFLLPSTKGALLSEPSPITTDGEMAHSLRSAHPVKITLQPESGTSDTLATIIDCSIDGVRVQIRMADESDSVTVTHGTGANNISTPDGTNLVMSGTKRIYTFHRAGGLWIYESSSGGGGGSTGGNVIIADGQKLEFTGTINSQTEGWFPPCQASCAQATGNKQFCIDCDDYVAYVGDGFQIHPLLGSGGSGATDADTAVDLNRVIDNRDGVNNALVIKDSGNAATRIYSDALGPVIDGVTGYGTTNTPAIPREIKTISLGAGAFSPDATLCKYNFNDVINTLIVPVTIECADDNNSTIYLNIAMPDRWDGVNLKVWSFLHTKETDPAGDIHTDWTGYCVESHGANGAASWAAEVANGAMDIDLDAATIVTHDEVITGTVGNVPLSGCTGAGKKSLWLRMQIDAAGTTADDAGAGTALVDQLFTKFVIEYGLKAFTD